MRAGSEIPTAVLEQLRSARLKSTIARRAIINLFLESDHPLSPSQIVKRLSDDRVNCNPATVYRFLLKLMKHGLIQRLDLGELYSSFVWSSSFKDGRAYIVCRMCKRIEILDEGRVHLSVFLDGSGYTSPTIQLTVFGHCARCLPQLR